MKLDKATYHDVEQNTKEWYQLKAGKLSGSSIGEVMSNLESDKFSYGFKNLAIKIAVEQITGIASTNQFYSHDMRRGHEQEPEARLTYENFTLCEVQDGGFFERGNLGCSPDGLVGSSGIIEIKSVLSHVHHKNITRGCVDPAYKWQCYFNLMITGRQWIDFISYCQDFPDDKKVFVFRIYADEITFEYEMMKTRINDFFELVENYKLDINQAQYFIN